MSYAIRRAWVNIYPTVTVSLAHRHDNIHYSADACGGSSCGPWTVFDHQICEYCGAFMGRRDPLVFLIIETDDAASE